MNIKNIFNSIANITGVSSAKLDKRVKTEHSRDKEAQLGYGQEEASQRRMSEDEVKQVLEYLQSLDGIKDNNLKVKYELIEDRFIVFIEDFSGKVVRRIPETELWFLYQKRNKESKKGQILNKAM